MPSTPHHPLRSWTRLPDHKLLDVRLSDLDLDLERSPVMPRIQQLYRELERRHLRLPAALLAVGRVVHAGRRARHRHSLLPRPSAAVGARAQPDARGRGRHAGVVHAHPAPRDRPRDRERLPPAPPPAPAAALRQDRRSPTRSTTRRSRTASATCSTSRPWYAQSHPDEDFAETFAVWLTPKSSWRRRYAGWPALRKLEYVDELMDELAGAPAAASRARRVVDPLRTLRKTLREHYREKRSRYGLDSLREYDAALRLRLLRPRRRSPAIPGGDASCAARAPQLRRKVRELDGRAPVHRRPGARRHDRALPPSSACG